MKAITIRQPYAQLIVRGLKHYETRSWPTKYRGGLAIHAGKRPAEDTLRELDEETAQRLRIDLGQLEDLPLGAVIGAVYIEDCIPITDEFRATLTPEELAVGHYEDGWYAWKIADDPLELSAPIPCAGAQGFWEFNAVKELRRKQ